VSDRPFIVVIGQGSARATPDQCSIHLSLNSLADSAVQALDLCNEAATRVIAAAAQAGIPRTDVQTMNLSVQDYRDPGQQKVTARLGSYQLSITVRALDALSDVVGKLTAAAGDALQIRAIHLSVSDPEPLMREARIAAVRDAQTKAHDLAQAAGRQLGSIVSIEEGSGPATFPKAVRASATAASSSPMPVEPGESTVGASVTVTFELDDPGQPTSE
jgi:uncharacterized protein YggE